MKKFMSDEITDKVLPKPSEEEAPKIKEVVEEELPVSLVI